MAGVIKFAFNRLFLFLAAAVVTVSVTAQSTATGNGTANASIVDGVAVTAQQDMLFGSIVQPDVAGNVTISCSLAGGCIQGGTLTPIAGPVQPALFHVLRVGNGGGNPKFWMQLPASATLNRSGGGASLTIDQFTADIDSRCYTTTGAAAPGPRGQCPDATTVGTPVQVGARLGVDAGQMSGDYVGTFAVIVHRW